MRVLVLCGGADTGGQGIRIRTAFARFRPDWEVRSVTASRNYMDYEEDVFWSTNNDQIAALYEQADVIHVRNTFDVCRRFEKRRRPRKTKPVVIHHHGSMFRTDHAHLLRQSQQLGAVGLVSTLDLLRYAPDRLTWLPIPHDLDELAAIRQQAVRDPDKVIIHHSPTNRRVKDTDLFEQVGDALMEKYPQVECRVVERVPWQQNLALKAEADIVYDQLQLGWGNNALEAWAMGVPVVAGVKDPSVRAMMVRALGDLPIVEASPETLYEALEGLVLSADKRRADGERGLAYVRQYHDHQVVVPRLVEAYERAAA